MIEFKFSFEVSIALSYNYYGNVIGYYIIEENRYYLFNGRNFSSYHGMDDSCRNVKKFWWKGEKIR